MISSGSIPKALPGGKWTGMRIIVQSKRQSDLERRSKVKQALAHKHPKDRFAYNSKSDSSIFGRG